jgi:hypothetical protein
MVKSLRMYETKVFLDALTKAVTQWATKTKEGKAAWKESCESFNLGDLDGWQRSVRLIEAMKDYGIYNLSIKLFGGSVNDGVWSYDTILVKKFDGFLNKAPKVEKL